MEDMKKEQIEVLNEAKGYCTNVLHCIDTVVPELKGDKKDDTDEYLRMTVDRCSSHTRRTERMDKTASRYLH